MKLSTLEKYNDIVIQMHDNPDADAVGSGYAIYRYFLSKGKKVRLIYSGSFQIKKSNMVKLIEALGIPVEYVTELEKPELLITVDCQYGEGNVTHFEADNVAMIDHHNTGRNSDEMCEIRSHIVSCSTVCYDMLRAEKYDVNRHLDVATALYYGLYMDSNSLSELRHPLERDMIDDLRVDNTLIKKLIYSNFTIEELETAGMAMLRYNYDEFKRMCVIKAKPCDPNILGLIGDLVLQGDTIDVCLIYNECPGGYKLSVRSCIQEVAANDFIIYIVDDIGNGGGHVDKAGGFINSKTMYEKHNAMSIETYIYGRINEYYENTEIINANSDIDRSGFELYEKKKVVRGFVKTTDIAPEGTDCKMRTYEGDVFIQTSDDVYIMIGHKGEAYPIERETFEKTYSVIGEPYRNDFEYQPNIRALSTNEVYDLLDFAKSCENKDITRIYAKKINKVTKIVTKWDYEKYMIGTAGDYLCYREDNEKDVYIVGKEMFSDIYRKI